MHRSFWLEKVPYGELKSVFVTAPSILLADVGSDACPYDEAELYEDGVATEEKHGEECHKSMQEVESLQGWYLLAQHVAEGMAEGHEGTGGQYPAAYDEQKLWEGHVLHFLCDEIDRLCDEVGLVDSLILHNAFVFDFWFDLLVFFDTAKLRKECVKNCRDKKIFS